MHLLVRLLAYSLLLGICSFVSFVSFLYSIDRDSFLYPCNEYNSLFAYLPFHARCSFPSRFARTMLERTTTTTAVAAPLNCALVSSFLFGFVDGWVGFVHSFLVDTDSDAALHYNTTLSLLYYYTTNGMRPDSTSSRASSTV